MDDNALYYNQRIPTGYSIFKTYIVESSSVKLIHSPINGEEMPESKQIVISIITTLFHSTYESKSKLENMFIHLCGVHNISDPKFITKVRHLITNDNFGCLFPDRGMRVPLPPSIIANKLIHSIKRCIDFGYEKTDELKKYEQYCIDEVIHNVGTLIDISKEDYDIDYENTVTALTADIIQCLFKKGKNIDYIN
jgi:hypothetical protein